MTDEFTRLLGTLPEAHYPKAALVWEEASFSYGDNAFIPCPVCGEAYHHVRRVGTEVDPGGDENGDGMYEGTDLQFEHPSGARRPAVRIDIEGECGHEWTLILQQHKGNLVLSARTGWGGRVSERRVIREGTFPRPHRGG